MDLYDDFLVFEPRDPDVLRNFMYEVVGFNLTAHRERGKNMSKRTSVMFLPFFDVLLHKVASAIVI